MNYQTLNQAGQDAVLNIIGNTCKGGLDVEAFFQDVEQARNDGRDDFEIRGQYTKDGRPVVVSILDEWFIEGEKSS